MDAISSLMLQEGWRKGPWTALEDRLLTEYVQQHGEGSWNSVAKLTGLRRSGKSCRLRWVNYLRPDLKRGKITPDEETVILQLHAMLGNRHLLHQYQLQQQEQRRQYLQSLQLLQQQQQQQHQQQQLLLQQQSQQQLVVKQQQLEQQSPPEPDRQAMMAMMDSLQSTGECYCSPVSPVLVPEQCCALPADDDEMLWDSLWRLVDGDGCGDGDGDGDGSSGGGY
ncbi:unnamed protein product [Miscanthus lutarioriparius]|uniref:Uncharacterized protein n=1 Tax=Miscanthus lutarioriparius TaxID=422564 RepID=A0A811ML28_9POAL|nr:unnamed protein product [Miscanthus lutarioriparius]